MKQTWSQYSDAELCTQLRADRRLAEAAFSELYNRYAKRIHAYCARILNDSDKTQDLFQETFLRFYQSAHAQQVTINVAAYLFRIARNLCLNSNNRPLSPEVVLENLEFPSEDTSLYEHNELIDMLSTAIKLLPEEYREAFVLREYDGCSYTEIAEIIEKPVSIVKIRLFRARRQLEKILAPYAQEFGIDTVRNRTSDDKS
jgi:RNA polymerase sigma-70 factor (ECF subfamily)